MREIIEDLLKRFPETRDSDTELLIKYIGINIENIDQLNALHNLVPLIRKLKIGSDSLRRSRQWIQAHNKDLQPSEYIKNKRHFLRKKMEINSLNGDL